MISRVTIGGSPLAYEARGTGPAILFLHAFPLGLEMWDEQVAALGTDHQTVRFDCRGFGGSPPGEALLTMERIADDAVGLLDRLAVSQAVVCGLSMGGYAAFALVRRHPHRLKGLVLADTRAAADGLEARENRSKLAEQVRRLGPQAAAEAFVPKLLGTTSHDSRGAVVERVRQMVLGGSVQGICDALAGLAARADSTPTLGQIDVPTLVVCGDEDSLTPVSEAEVLSAGIPGGRLEVIPGAGHLSNLENPEAFNAALRRFVSGLTRQPE